MTDDRLEKLMVALAPYGLTANASPQDILQAARIAVPNCTDAEVVMAVEQLSEFFVERAKEVDAEIERRGGGQ